MYGMYSLSNPKASILEFPFISDSIRARCFGTSAPPPPPPPPVPEDKLQQHVVVEDVHLFPANLGDSACIPELVQAISAVR